MKYFKQALLGLISLGFLGLIVGVIGFMTLISYYSKDLPDHETLKDYSPSVVTRLYAGDGRLLAEFAQQKRVFVPIEAIPDQVKHAFIAAEDKNFYSHNGLDYIAIGRAVLRNFKNLAQGRRPEGASTITQQVAKNFLLTNEVSLDRKLKEAILAVRMEKALSKEQLLELYLNEIYLGAGTYGVAAAGLHYFGKSLDELDIHEIAYLAALPKAPNNYHPIRRPEAATVRRNWVIGRMAEDGYIAPSQAEIARLKPLSVDMKATKNAVRGSYFAEEVRRELQDRYGDDGLYQSGLAVRTSLDPKLQEIAEQVLQKGLMSYDKRHGWRGALGRIDNVTGWKEGLANFPVPEGKLNDWHLAVVLDVSKDTALIGLDDGSQGQIKREDMKWARESLNDGHDLGAYVARISQVVERGDIIVVEPMDEDGVFKLQQIPVIQGALIAMDPFTGRVLAMQGGWKQGSSEFNRATQAKRQPGSAFKPFVYLAALDHGFTPATLVVDAPFEIEDKPGSTWSPSNYTDEFYGPTPIRVGLEKSKNLMTVRLAHYIGMDVISDYAEKFGVADHMQPLLANSLGAGETTLFDMTAAYAVFVNGGKKVQPTFVDRIQNRWGKTIFKHDDRECKNCGDMIKWVEQNVPNVPNNQEQIADPRTAYQIVSMLEGVVQRGTGVRIRSLGRPLAGKTGTTNESRDAWFIGFSPDLVVGVYTGFDVPKSLGDKETGSSVAVPIFKDFMELALEGKPAIPFRVPAGVRHVQINAENGTRANIGAKRTIWEAFVAGTEPGENVYVLDETGINTLPASALESPEYYGDMFYQDYLRSLDAPSNVYKPSEPARNTISSGTGGIY